MPDKQDHNLTKQVLAPASIQDLHVRLDRLMSLNDPTRIASLSTELLVSLREVQQEVSAVRDGAVLCLHEEGNSLHTIARVAGLTRGRVFQIVQRGRGGANKPSIEA